MTKAFFIAIFTFFSLSAFAQEGVLGKWKTIDDETGKPKSIIELYEKNGKLYGKVVKLFREPSEDQDPVCDKCTDDRKGKKIIGMDLVRDMEKDGDEWEDGTILDPKKGKIYDCKLWLEDGKLQVRGYIAFLFRTQVWVREK